MGLRIFQDTEGPLNGLSWETGSFLPSPNTHWFLTARSYEALFPGAGTLGCAVLPGAGIAHSPGVPPGCYLPHVNLRLPIPLATAAWPPTHWVLSPAPISAPPTPLDEYFFFKSLVVGLPYSLIVWQFWLFYVSRLVVILLMAVRGGKAHLCMLLSRPEVCTSVFKVLPVHV